MLVEGQDRPPETSDSADSTYVANFHNLINSLISFVILKDWRYHHKLSVVRLNCFWKNSVSRDGLYPQKYTLFSLHIVGSRCWHWFLDCFCGPWGADPYSLSQLQVFCNSFWPVWQKVICNCCPMYRPIVISFLLLLVLRSAIHNTSRECRVAMWHFQDSQQHG